MAASIQFRERFGKQAEAAVKVLRAKLDERQAVELLLDLMETLYDAGVVRGGKLSSTREDE